MSRLDELIRLLEAYEPPAEELVARRDMLALAHTRGDVFSRDVFEPGHFTASGFVVSPDGESLLLVHHRRLDRWLQPGGHIDPTGERVIEASMREVEEETGIGELTVVGGGIFDIDVHQVPAYGKEPGHAHFDVRFLFQAADADVVAADEVHDAAWVPLVDVADRTTDRSVLRAVEKLAHHRFI
jgi:8-oxo-dGTP pyrophosphatase MutT (NUDIX family)